jgi:hypothetical protein
MRSCMKDKNELNSPNKSRDHQKRNLLRTLLNLISTDSLIPAS